MSRPFFSIVIPTRNRHETLPYAIKTVLQQDFEDYEIIVSDNSDPDNDLSQKAVADFASEKIRYFRTPKPLAMHDNWEYAMEQTTGEFIAYIGDDDGLMPNCLKDVFSIVNESKIDVVKSNWVAFVWQNAIMERKIYKTPLLIIPPPYTPEIRSSEKLLRQYTKMDLSITYNHFPHIYNGGYIHRRYFERIKKKTGRYFYSVIPDVYTGFAIASMIDQFFVTGKPLNISGTSAKSNGTTVNYLKTSHPIFKEFMQMAEQSPVKYHPWVPDIRGYYTSLYEPYLQASERVFPEKTHLRISRQKLMEKILSDIYVMDLDEWATTLSKIRAVVKDDKELAEFVENNLKNRNPSFAIPPSDLEHLEDGFFQGMLRVDCQKFGINDISQAATFASQLMGSYANEHLLPRQVSENKLSMYRRVRTAARILIKGR